MTELVKFLGEGPAARFGHTITLVSKSYAILFGGAIGDTGKYNITGDTFGIDLTLRKWKKLTPSG
jgi:protein phosphatase